MKLSLSVANDGPSLHITMAIWTEQLNRELVIRVNPFLQTLLKFLGFMLIRMAVSFMVANAVKFGPHILVKYLFK